MKILILNGAHAADTELDALQELLCTELRARGHPANALVLRNIPVAYCLGCYDCWLKTPGVCRTRDAGPGIASEFINSDVVFFLTPVTFGGYSSQLKKALDRTVGLILSPFFTRIDGEVHHQVRYDAYPKLVAIGLMDEGNPEEETIFHTLVHRNAINLHSPWYASRVFYRQHPANEINDVLRLTLAQMESAA